MTEDERRERIEATASRMIAELLERAANGEALPVQGAFVLRIRALAEEISDADSITIEARDMALFKDLAAQRSWRAPRPPSTVPRPPAPAAPPSFRLG